MFLLTIAFTALYFSYAQKVKQRDALLQSINTVQQGLLKINAEKQALGPQIAQLEAKLTEATARLSQAKKSYTTSVEAIEYGTELYQLADDAALTVISITNSETTEELEGNITYIITTFDITVQGMTSDLLDFVSVIAQHKYFASASLDSLGITEMDAEEPLLRITITVYCYKGS